jgi:hypothetical protein
MKEWFTEVAAVRADARQRRVADIQHTTKNVRHSVIASGDWRA